MPKPRVEPDSVFLNVPYDLAFERLYLAYIAGLSTLGLAARATLEIPGGERRLDRIFTLLQSCTYSIHDLSRVQLNRTRPATPRFNMPMELGLAIAWSKLSHGKHSWFVFETEQGRALKSISDLNGTDLNIHGGTVAGVMRELCNAFVRRRGGQPNVPQMMSVYRKLRAAVPAIQQRTGADSLFESRMFIDIGLAAGKIVTSERRTES